MVAIRVFISYKSEYRDLAIRVRDKLRAWGHQTWFDRDNIGKGEYFREAIQNGLENSDVVIGIVTQEALKSREVLMEWDYAFSGKSRLLLLRYQEIELPYWLSGIQYIDFSSNIDSAFEELQSALIESDTSHTLTNAAPEFIARHRATATDSHYQASVQTDSAQKSREEQNRSNMLQNVYHAWIEGVLHPNLESGSLDIGVGLQADAVLRYADYSEYQLPASGRDIGQIFHDMNGELLILGKPGSGKTILLLQLAEYLLAKAQDEPTQPIPVVFNLSSWASKQDPLERWLIDELYRSYAVPRKTAEQMLEHQQLTLLMDGLDEVAENVRDDCVEHINVYRTQNIGVDIAVCSRIADYERLTQQLDLNGAILLQDLSEEQIRAYLTGQSFAGIWDLLANEEVARNMANTPFLLNTMKTTYQDIPYTGSPHNHLKLEDGSERARRNHLFDRNIKQRLKGQTEYPSDRTSYYLKWLAWQMLKHNTTVFYIEDLQADWARDAKRAQMLIEIPLMLWKPYYKLLGLARHHREQLSEEQIKQIKSYGEIGVVAELMGGLPYEWSKIKFAEQVLWKLDRQKSQKSIMDGLFTATITVMILVWLGAAWPLCLLGGLLMLILPMSITLITRIDITSNIRLRSQPNSGFKSSLQNNLVIMLFVMFPFGLFLGLLIGLLFSSISWFFGADNVLPLPLTILLVLFGMVFAMLFFGLPLGLSAIIQHMILRRVLSQEAVIPAWRYDRFLDYAASLGILRKVGGGYIFRHRMLLEYFAEQWDIENRSQN